MKLKLEYIWLDGSQPQRLRSKTKIESITKNVQSLDPNLLPIWSFDGSSTGQAKAGKGKNTDCLLKPVYVTMDPLRGGENRLVLCEVLNPDGTPHETNKRRALSEMVELLKIKDDVQKSELPWFGWEQEYTLTHKTNMFGSGEGIPLGFNYESLSEQPRPQGEYYCGIGSDSVIGRQIVEEHLDMCLSIGLDISGINAEVLLGQWEYQVGPVKPLNGSDQLWMSRYLLERVAEKHGVKISLHPKLMKGDWNGSGCHVNFSTKEMRENDGLKLIEEAMYKLKEKHKEHISVYGLNNEERMTGEHETSGIHEFTHGYSTRDTSIRIPAQAIIDKKGYFEDRRPASNCDPYLVSRIMLETVYSEDKKAVI